MDRLVWTPAEVVDVDGPRAMLRAYLEQKAVRELLATVCRRIVMQTPSHVTWAAGSDV